MKNSIQMPSYDCLLDYDWVCQLVNKYLSHEVLHASLAATLQYCLGLQLLEAFVQMDL